MSEILNCINTLYIRIRKSKTFRGKKGKKHYFTYNTLYNTLWVCTIFFVIVTCDNLTKYALLRDTAQHELVCDTARKSEKHELIRVVSRANPCSISESRYTSFPFKFLTVVTACVTTHNITTSHYIIQEDDNNKLTVHYHC